MKAELQGSDYMGMLAFKVVFSGRGSFYFVHEILLHIALGVFSIMHIPKQ